MVLIIIFITVNRNFYCKSDKLIDHLTLASKKIAKKFKSKMYLDLIY